jgi:hypothetical protein
MPTINPRVNVTLSPGLDDLLARLASHQRASKSQVLRELLEAAEPALLRVVALMDASAQASATIKGRLASTMDAAIEGAEAELADVLGVIDSRTSDLVHQAEAVKGRRPSRAENPPPSNRGVKSGSRAPRSPRRVQK